jgi:hypothetical protein
VDKKEPEIQPSVIAIPQIKKPPEEDKDSSGGFISAFSGDPVS